MLAFVTSRLDCCNSLLYGLPSSEISKLQHIQNSVARLVTSTKKYEHISPILRKLHWLPIQYRIDYKIALLTFKAIHGMTPTYISELITHYDPGYKLRSSSAVLLDPPPKIPKTVYYGERSFAEAAPEIWNQLPTSIRSITTLGQFKKNLKTHFFKCVDFSL